MAVGIDSRLEPDHIDRFQKAFFATASEGRDNPEEDKKDYYGYERQSNPFWGRNELER